MGRISLYDKLSKDTELFKELLSRLVTHPKPTQYIMSKYDVTYLTAKKMWDQINNKVPTTKVDVQKNKMTLDEAESLQADYFLQKVDQIFNSRETKPTVRTFSKISDDLEEIKSQSLLRKIFKKLTGEDSDREFALNRAIKYNIQVKYYSLVFGKECPQSIKDLAKQYVEDTKLVKLEH